LAAILKSKKEIENKKIGLILSGGNVDLNTLPFS
jgi:threonine dehydratase